MLPAMHDGGRPGGEWVVGAPRGLTAMLGTVQLRLVGCEATFAFPAATGQTDPLHLRTAEVVFPGAVVGRGRDADVRVTGRGSDEVSRHHLRIEPIGRQWRVRDLATRNGTWEPAADGGDRWNRLPPSVAIPVTDGWRLSLGAGVRIAFKLIPTAEQEVPTAALGHWPGRSPWEDRIRPPELEAFAAALLAGRRADPRNQAVPSVDQLAAELHVARSTAYDRLRRLRELPELASLKPGGDVQAVADALTLAFPYLVEA